MNRHSLSLKGGQTCFLLVFHAILRLILNYRFCAFSFCELSPLKLLVYSINTLMLLFQTKGHSSKEDVAFTRIGKSLYSLSSLKGCVQIGLRNIFFGGGAVSFYRTVNQH